MNIEERAKKYPQYFKSVKGLQFIDIYRVLKLFGVVDNEIGHAVKKLLAPGQRGVKEKVQDIKEAIASLERHLEMIEEDHFPTVPPCPPPFTKLKPLEVTNKDKEAEDLKLSRMAAISQLSFGWVSDQDLVRLEGSRFICVGMVKEDLESFINDNMKVKFKFSTASPVVKINFVPNNEYNKKS